MMHEKSWISAIYQIAQIKINLNLQVYLSAFNIAASQLKGLGALFAYLLHSPVKLGLDDFLI